MGRVEALLEKKKKEQDEKRTVSTATRTTSSAGTGRVQQLMEKKGLSTAFNSSAPANARSKAALAELQTTGSTTYAGKTYTAPVRTRTGQTRDAYDASVRKSYAERYGTEMSRLEELRRQAAVDLDMAALNQVEAQMKELRASAGKQTIGDRVSDTLSGALNSAASGFVNAAGAVSNAFQDPEHNRRQVVRLQKALETGRTSDGKLINDAQRRSIQESILRLQEEAAAWESENSATNRLYRTADALNETGQTQIEAAKQGLGAVGQFAVDAGVAGTQLAGDIGFTALTGGSALIPMAVRAFGGSAQEARQSGASLGQQLAYGAGSALISTAVERIASVAAPFRKAFGGGVLDDAIRKVTGRLGQSSAGKLALSALSEGGEEFVEAVIQPVLQRATYEPDAAFDLEDALYQAAIGFVLGSLGGGVEVVGSTVSNRQAERILSDPASMEKLGVTLTGGMTQSQRRAAVKEAVAARKAARQTPVQQAPAAQPATVRENTLANAREMLGENGYKAFELGLREDSDPEAYFQDFTRAYNAGRNGTKLADAGVQTLTEEQAKTAYVTGKSDAQTNLKTEVADYGTERNEAGIGSTGRQYSVASQEPGVVLAEGTGTAPAGQSRSAQAQRAVEIRARTQAAGIVSQSTASLGIGAGTNKNTVQVLPASIWTDEMRALSRAQSAKGRQVIYFTGSLEMRDSGGKFNARGAVSFDGKRIWIRADHDALTIEQIGRHEEYHAAAKKDPTLNKRLKEQISRKHGEGWAKYLSDAYTDLYFTDKQGNITADVEYILEEILADAYAGIDILDGRDVADARATEATGEVQETVRAADTENAASEDGEVRYSLDGEAFTEDKYFSRQMDKWDALADGARVKVGTVQEGSALQRIGLPASGMYFDVGKIKKAMSDHNDHLSPAVLKSIPDLLNDPVVIAEYAGAKNTVNVYGNLFVNDTPVVVGIVMRLDRSGQNVINNIRTVHARKDFAKQITDDSVLYLSENKKKTRKWFQVCGNLNVPLEGAQFGVIRSIAFESEKSNAKFSRELESISDLRQQNEALREQVEYWKGQTRRTETPTLRQADVDKLARSIVRDYDSGLDASDISDDLKALGEYIVRGGDGEAGLNWNEIKDRAVRIARSVVNSAHVLVNGEAMEDYQGIRSYLKKHKLAFHDQGDIADFADFRKRNFGRFTISKDGTPVDVVWTDLQERFGESYFPSGITHPADQLVHIAELLDNMEPIFENPFSYYISEATESVANDIIDRLFVDELRLTPPTFADRQARKLQKAKAAGRERTKRALEKVRADRDAKILDLKDHYRTKEAKGRESRKARELRGKIQRHAKDLSAKLLRPTDKKHIPEELRGAVAKLLESINLESAKDTPEHVTQRTKAFAELRAQYVDLAGRLVIDPDLMGDDGLLSDVIALADKRIADMNSEELEIIWQTLRAVEASITSANKMFTKARFRTIAEAADALRQDNAGKSAKTEYNYIGGAQKLTGLDMLTPEGYFHRLGGGGDAIFRMMRNAQDEHIRIMKEVSDFTHDTLGKVDVKGMERELHTVTLGGQEVQLSTAQLMELYALMRREQARAHILTGGILPGVVSGKGLKKIGRPEPVRGVTLEEISEALSLLSAEQAAIAESLQDYASTELSGFGNKASMEVYNYKKFTEEHYWPIRSNRDETVKSTEKDTQVTSVANRGFTKGTKPNPKNSVMLGSIFDTFSTHASEMATYAAWLGATEDMNRIRNFTFLNDEGRTSGTVGEILKRVHGSQGDKYLENLLADIANGVRGTHAETEYMRGLSGNYKAASVGANLRVIIQQPTSILRALDMIDLKYLTAGLNPSGGWKKALKYAPIAQWKDWGYFDINTGRQMKDVLFDSDSVLQKVKSVSMAGAGMMDSVAWGGLWNAVEAETKSKHKDLTPGSKEYYEAVAERFTEIVDHTQVVDGILQRSQIMRSASGLTKMATSFMGEPTKQYNMLLSAAYDARHGGKEQRTAAKKRLARTTFALAVSGVINAVAQSIMDAVRDDDKEKEYWDKWLTAFTGITGEEEGFGKKLYAFWSGNLGSVVNPAQYIPFAKDVVSLIQGYDVSRMDMEGVGNTVDAAKGLFKALKGEGKYTKEGAFANLFLQAARLIGVPVANLKRDVWSFVMLAAVETENYLLQYRMERFWNNLNSTSNSKLFMDILYNAYVNDPEAYEIIYADMVKGGYDPANIKSGMESRMKKAQGVKEVEDLEKRYLSPEQQSSYDRTIGGVQSSRLWSRATEQQQDHLEDILYDLTVGNNAGAKLQEKIDGGEAYGLDETEYLLYRLALEMADKPNDSGNLGTYTGDEVEAAIGMVSGLNDRTRSYLWKAQGKSEKSNPWK